MERGAIESNEAITSAGAEMMKCLRDQFFACSGFARDQHRRAARTGAVNFIGNLLHRRAAIEQARNGQRGTEGRWTRINPPYGSSYSRGLTEAVPTPDKHLSAHPAFPRYLVAVDDLINP